MSLPLKLLGIKNDRMLLFTFVEEEEEDVVDDDADRWLDRHGLVDGLGADVGVFIMLVGGGVVVGAGSDGVMLMSTPESTLSSMTGLSSGFLTGVEGTYTSPKHIICMSSAASIVLCSE